MKQFIKFMLSVALLLFAFDGYTQVPGKTYNQGDIINIDGINSIILNDDDTGLHGLAIAYSITDIEDNAAKLEKKLKKQEKKGSISAEEMALCLENYSNQKTFPSVQSEKSKGNRRKFHTQEFAEQIPKGWRLATPDDAISYGNFLRDISNFNMKVFNKPQFNPFTKNYPDLWLEYLFNLNLNRFIGYDGNDLVCTKLYRKDLSKSKTSFAFPPFDTFNGAELTVTFKNF